MARSSTTIGTLPITLLPRSMLRAMTAGCLKSMPAAAKPANAAAGNSVRASTKVTTNRPSNSTKGASRGISNLSAAADDNLRRQTAHTTANTGPSANSAGGRRRRRNSRSRGGRPGRSGCSADCRSRWRPIPHWPPWRAQSVHLTTSGKAFGQLTECRGHTVDDPVESIAPPGRRGNGQHGLMSGQQLGKTVSDDHLGLRYHLHDDTLGRQDLSDQSHALPGVVSHKLRLSLGVNSWHRRRVGRDVQDAIPKPKLPHGP